MTLQRAELQRLLALAWPELEIVASCEDGDEALAAIADLRPASPSSTSGCPA